MKIARKNIGLGIIVCLASFLRLFRLSRADMMTDAAHYSFRAIGYLDYLSFDKQTTPIVWFKSIPWWGILSFHDHPPLVFLIQNLFFKMFRINTFIARLPFALFGIGSVFLVYLLAQKLYGGYSGYLAALILSVCNYHVWISRVGYFESILSFFVLLAVYYFVQALEDDKYFIHFGIYLGLAFLCKYTAFFLIPALFVFTIIWRRDVFRLRKFLFGLLICLLIFSPVVLYNLKMYQTRGHFDLQFAKVFGQDMSDWSNIKGGISFNFMHSLKDIWTSLYSNFSFVIFICP